jgi:hypothetical protein
MSNAHPQSNEAHHGKASAGGRSRYERLEALGHLPQTVGARLKENPAAGFAFVGTVSFLLGGLFGSKLGRLAVAAALPILVNRILAGRIGSEIVQYVEGLVAPPETGRGARA